MTAETFERATFLDRDIQQIAKQLEYWNKAVCFVSVNLDDRPDRYEGYSMGLDVEFLPFDLLKPQMIQYLTSLMNEKMREFEAL